jgi:hypothetical protein
MAQATNAWLQQRNQQGWQEKMMRLQAQLQEEAIRRANAGGIWGDIGQVAGTAAGAWLSPGGIWG